MKHLKTYNEKPSLEYEVYIKHTNKGNTVERFHYSTQYDVDSALKKVKIAINSFLSLDQKSLDDWSLDNYWIEVYDNDNKIQVINKREIDARFNANKYNL